MADLTLTFGSSFGPGPPAKRKRLEFSGDTQTPSTIVDRRCTVSQALRLDCDFITVAVGQDELKVSFKVHEHAICDRSEFFRNSMKPEWSSMRADPRVIELPEDDPDAFSLYRTWVYSGKLAILPDKDCDLNSTTERYHTLAYAYVLGERLLDTDFKNAIADAYVLYARGIPPSRRYYPSNEEIRIIYEGTREESPIRQLLVDIWYCRGKAEWLEKDADLPREFLTNVVRELLRVRVSVENLSRPWKNSHEQYHEK